jgi:phage shock protein A
MSFIARVRNLLRGLLARWIGRREHRNPEAVYEAAIEERLAHYATLRAAAAGVLYMRSKLTKELELKSGEHARAQRQLAAAVDDDDDAVAVALIGRRDLLGQDIERVSAELRQLTEEAEAAKTNLVTFHNEIARLREEKVRMLARLANARARLRLQEALNGLSPDADIRALEGVRDHINRLVTEAQLSRDLGDTDLERRLGRIREAEAESAARAQLDELKRARKPSLLPLVVPRPAPSSAG